MKKILLMTVMVILAAACHVELMSAYQEGFKHPGYVMYFGATENGKLEFIDPALDNEAALSFTSSDESVVSFNGKEMKINGAGEALITAAYSAYQSFTTGVKVIDPTQENEVYIRVKSDETVSDGDEGVILAKYSMGKGLYHYAVLYNSTGTTANVNRYDTYGDGEIAFFCTAKTSEWPKGASLTFIGDAADETFKIIYGKSYLQPNMKFGSDGDDAKATIAIDNDDYAKIHYGFGAWKNAEENFVVFDGQNFKYSKLEGSKLPVELYLRRTVKFEAPDVNVAEVYIDNSVRYASSSGNIQLSDGKHSLTFKVPDGIKLYYKLSSSNGTQPMAPLAETQEWFRYESGYEIPVSNASGAIEYYAETHGLQSGHVVKTFTVPTGLSNPTIGSESECIPEYFNMNGIRVDSSDLKPGIYIRKTGMKIEKVVK